jgi:hypothetical protein
MLGAEEPSEVGVAIRRAEPRDDVLDRSFRVGLSRSGDAVEIKEEQRRRLIGETVVAALDAAVDDMRDLPPRPPAFGVGWRATDQEDIALAGVITKVLEQSGDRCRNARHALAEPGTAGILLDGAVRRDRLANKPAADRLQFGDVERRMLRRERNDDRVGDKPAGARKNGLIEGVDGLPSIT